MKTKKMLSILLLLSVCVATALNVYNQSQTPQYSDLTIANIEAFGGDDNTGEGSGGLNGPAYLSSCKSTVDSTTPCGTETLYCLAQENTSCQQLYCSTHQSPLN